MSEGLSKRAQAALDAMWSGRMEKVDGWYAVGMMENVGVRTVEELRRVPELEWRGSAWVRFRSMAAVGDDRVVVLLAEILAVLRDRL